jgi:hypothetical protein
MRCATICAVAFGNHGLRERQEPDSSPTPWAVGRTHPMIRHAVGQSRTGYRPPSASVSRSVPRATEDRYSRRLKGADLPTAVRPTEGKGSHLLVCGFSCLVRDIRPINTPARGSRAAIGEPQRHDRRPVLCHRDAGPQDRSPAVVGHTDDGTAAVVDLRLYRFRPGSIAIGVIAMATQKAPAR